MSCGVLEVLLTLALAVDDPPQAVTFKARDGGLIHADLYGSGPHAVVLAHGGRFNKGSWAPQARLIAAAGFRVLAFDFRGYGKSRGEGDADPLAAPLWLDVSGAVAFLKANGASQVFVVGGSMGGTAAAQAAAEGPPGEIDKLVLLAAPPGKAAGRLHVPTLLIIARDDPTADGTPRLAAIQLQFDTIPGKKKLVVLEGSAHAQALFDTPAGGLTMKEILAFLAPPQ